MNCSTLRPMSVRRFEETGLYKYRRRQFLLAHPYCQVFLAEHGIAEEDAIRDGGRVVIGGVATLVPLSTQVHHKNKRRGNDLLGQEYWMAVSDEAHHRIESNKTWARASNFLLNF